MTYLGLSYSQKPVSWSGRPLTLESGLLESVAVCSGASVPSLSLLSLLSYGFMSSFNFCPEPYPFPVSMVCSTYCLNQWESRRGLCEGGEEAKKPSHLRAALQQPRAPGSSFSKATGEHLLPVCLGCYGGQRVCECFCHLTFQLASRCYPLSPRLLCPYYGHSQFHLSSSSIPPFSYQQNLDRQNPVQYLGFGPVTYRFKLMFPPFQNGLSNLFRKAK